MSHRVRALTHIILAALTIGVAGSLRAQATPNPLDARESQVVAAVNGAAVALDTIFAPETLAQLPATRLQAIFNQLRSQLGAVQRAVPDSTGRTATHGVYRLTLAGGYTMDLTLDIGAQTPHRVTSILFGPPSKQGDTFADVMRDLAALPGHTAFFAARIDSGRLVPLAASDSARPMALGSAFKLFVLAELVHQVEAGSRHWADVVPLNDAWRSLPSGTLQSWPAGSRLTLESLATLMISQSDNTAADHLLHILGREKVEQFQGVVGNTHATRNMPFLSTREMFTLKSPAQAALQAAFLAGDLASRRQVIARVDALGYDQVAPDYSRGPVSIDSIEWFASVSDMARTMLWLRDHSAAGAGAAARAIMAVNAGLPWSKRDWAYVGYKGGSEPGVLEMTYLMQRPGGTWYVMAGAWNNPEKAVNEAVFGVLMKRAGDLLAK